MRRPNFYMHEYPETWFMWMELFYNHGNESSECLFQCILYPNKCKLLSLNLPSVRSGYTIGHISQKNPHKPTRAPHNSLPKKTLRYQQQIIWLLAELDESANRLWKLKTIAVPTRSSEEHQGRHQISPKSSPKPSMTCFYCSQFRKTLLKHRLLHFSRMNGKESVSKARQGRRISRFQILLSVRKWYN